VDGAAIVYQPAVRVDALGHDRIDVVAVAQPGAHHRLVGEPRQAIDVLTVRGRRRVTGQHLRGDRLHQVLVVRKGAVEVEDQRAEGHGGAD
jgi:hypothetical protein